MSVKCRAWRGALSWCVCAAMLCMSGYVTPAQAESSLSSSQRQKRHALMTQANKLWAAQRHEEALRLYEQAYALQAHPDVLYRIGQAHEKLGHDKIAADTYAQYALEVPDNPHIERINERISVLRQSDRIAPPMLRITTSPSGATMVLDGQPLDKVTPYTVASTSGEHTLTIRLEGHVEQTHAVRLADGEQFDATYTLEPIVEPEPLVEAKPEPKPAEARLKSKPEKYDLDREVPATLVDISPPAGWKALGYVGMIYGTVGTAIGLFGLSLDGVALIDVYGPFLLVGASGLGVGSYILFVKDWKPRIKQSSASSSMGYNAPQGELIIPARAQSLTTQGSFRGLNLKLHF